MLDHNIALPDEFDRRRLWCDRVACVGLGILAALGGRMVAGWITGPAPDERLVTLPAAIGLLLWLLFQALREVLVLLRWPPRRATGGMGGMELLGTLIGFGAMLLPRHWLGWGLLGLAGAVLVRCVVGLMRRRRGVAAAAGAPVGSNRAGGLSCAATSASAGLTGPGRRHPSAGPADE